MALGFAMLDFPLSIFIQNTLEGAVREGVRYAITQPSGGTNGQDSVIKSYVESKSMGFLNDADITSGKSSFSITYYSVDPNTGVLSQTSSNDGGNIIVISATISQKFMAPLWRSAGLVPFSASSSDMMEAPPNNTPVPR